MRIDREFLTGLYLGRHQLGGGAKQLGWNKGAALFGSAFLVALPREAEKILREWQAMEEVDDIEAARSARKE